MKVLEELLSRYKREEYEDVVSFYKSFKTPFFLPFEGMGSFWMSGINNDFLVIDRDIIFFRQDEKKFLQSIQRLDISLLKTTNFSDGITSGYIVYRDFEMELMTEIKMYEHAEETELVFAPSRKIDQIKRISLYIEDNGVKYRGEDFASLEEVLKSEKIIQLIEERMDRLVESKKAQRNE